jgi:hypothetical protein
MRKYSFLAAALLLFPGPFCLAQRVEVSIPVTKPLTGHLILVFAKEDRPEPRFQLSEDYLSAEGLGVDVENLKPRAAIVVNAKTFGNPMRSLNDLEAGDYYVQAGSTSRFIWRAARRYGCRRIRAWVSTGIGSLETLTTDR